MNTAPKTRELTAAEVASPTQQAPRPLKTRIDELAAELGAQADSVVIIVTERDGTRSHRHLACSGNMYAAEASVRATAKAFDQVH